MSYLPIDQMWNDLTPEQWNELKPWEILFCDYLFREPGYSSTTKCINEHMSRLQKIDPELAASVRKAHSEPKKTWESQEFRAWALANRSLILEGQ